MKRLTVILAIFLGWSVFGSAWAALPEAGASKPVAKASPGTENPCITLGGDWQASDALRWNGSYTFSQSKGNTASGLILTELPAVDGSINNSVHTLGLGADYALKKNLKLKASYAYDYYTDKVYSTLTGGYHTLMFGVSVGF